uniref:Uncharacterized protein n=1 Tax=Rhizophora mucronata TaxID=61149 RepID=A0A2P2PHG6_RHIMU
MRGIKDKKNNYKTSNSIRDMIKKKRIIK